MSSYFAVMGNPIAHSLSPIIHQYFAKEIGIELIYEKITVDEACFEQCVRDFFAVGGQGLNISLPFKQRAFAMAENSTLRCQKAKAANTLWLKDGKLQADNTDGVGLLTDLARYFSLADKQVLILGAGGAARGIITPLLATNIGQLTVANRGVDKLNSLQHDFPQIITCSLAELKNSYDLIINATSLAFTVPEMNQPSHRTTCSIGSLPFPSVILRPDSFCYDLTYTARGSTFFVQWARKQGCAAHDGLGMLIEQAAETFFIWHGVRPQTR